MNQTRRGMEGINSRPLPQGRLSALPNGQAVIETNQGARLQVRPNGSVEQVTLRDGRVATYHPNGQLGSVHAPGIQIDHGLRGERTIVTESNGRRLVSEGPQQGYLERPYLRRNGYAYVQRTYTLGGQTYARVYRDHFYLGVHYYLYVPAHYYRPGFYEYAENPWPAPVAYPWGWSAAPWFTFNAVYFQPAPVYSSSAWWLADYTMGASLQIAYTSTPNTSGTAPDAPEGGEAVPSGGGEQSGQFTPEVRQEVAQQIQGELAAEQTEASMTSTPGLTGGADTPPAALDPNETIFVVANNVLAANGAGQECALTGGDVIRRVSDTPGDDGRVSVSVVASKPNDCGVGISTMVTVTDLQEMHNSLRASMDSGLEILAGNQNNGGLPTAPDPATIPGEVPPPAPDANVDGRLQEQDKLATQVETQVQQQIQVETM